MTTIKETISLAVPAEKAWNLIRTFNLDYFPGYPHQVTGSGAGAERSFKLPNGEMTEQITAFDDANMQLSYTIVSSPWPVKEYLATIKVEPSSTGSEILWSARFEPDKVAESEAIEIVADTFKMNLKAINRFLSK